VTTGAFQSALSGYSDYYLAKFSASGTLLWSTFYGGSLSASQLSGLAVDSHDNAIIVGRANDVDFPVTAGAYQTINAGGTGDGFVIKFDPAGSRLWATFYGGSDADEFHQVAVDGDDNLYVCGCTLSGDFPTTTGAFQSRSGKKADAVLVKLGANGFPLWSTYFGGRGDDYGMAVALDNSANVILHGYTTSQNFPVTPGAFQSAIAGSSDLYLAKFSSSGAQLWASYLGGSGEDIAGDVATDSQARIVFTGYTSSTDFPVTPAALQTAYGAGNYDGYIGSFDAAGGRLWTTYCGGNDNWDVMSGIATDGNDDVIVAGYGYSTDFPVTAGALQTVNNGGSGDMYITRLDPTGQQVWGTYLGGAYGDVGRCVATTANGLILVGGTAGPGVPLLNAYQAQPTGLSDVYVICLDATGHLPGYNMPPVAVASASVTSGNAPLAVQFTGSASSDPDGSIVSWTWDFGDGGTAAIADPSHTYSNPGVYTATLTVTDDGNASATDDVTVTVTSTSSGSVRVASQDVTRVLVQSKSDRWEGRDLVVVRDAYNIPVAGAVVSANYSGPNAGTTSGTSDANGEVLLATASQKSPSGLWCFDITGVQASGYTYDASSSVTHACEAATPKSVATVPAVPILSVSPNPFSVRTSMTVSLPAATDITLIVYDALGREIRTLAQGNYPRGAFIAEFDASGLARGTYYVRLYAGPSVRTRMLLVE
ncbi:MAG: PKD domain-containing protein, partial [Bacteroidota bacterium]|nr:PKD domain-containing protein [Bacteroidota bacterium]